VFLGKEGEFGTIAPGKRADLLLVNGNPLQDFSTLRQPIGVMVRGKWIGASELSHE
jgi:imidazolonepropionase-like amidohydrolase